MSRSSTTWAPGRSGNPGGRPKLIAEVRDLARGATEAAIGTLIEIMQDGRAPAAARVSAATALLDRAWGKPAQAVAVAAVPRTSFLGQALMEVHDSRSLENSEAQPIFAGERTLVAAE